MSLADDSESLHRMPFGQTLAQLEQLLNDKRRDTKKPYEIVEEARAELLAKREEQGFKKLQGLQNDREETKQEKRARKAFSEFKEQFEMIVARQREPNLIMLEKQLKEPWQMSEL